MIPPRIHMHFLFLALLVVALLCYARAHTLPDSPPDDIRSVPDWAKDAVWYQIFPERFRNGDPSNDPTVHDLEGSWPHEKPDEWHISPWTSDWYELQPWEKRDDRGFYYRVQQRRYGGDLQGVIDQLQYLKDLGVNAIYFNPVFEAPSLHKYDATMYHHIDNNFGPDPEGDRRLWEQENPADPSTWKWTSADRLFLQLLEKAHSMGIRVVIDGVFNHVGMTFWAFRDVQKNGDKSAYKDWFIIDRYDDPGTPESEFVYQGWNGVRELPEIREDANGLVAAPREHIKHIVRRWMDPNDDGNPSDGIDGWRLDVAEKVGVPFWTEFRRWVRGINPNAYIVGEVWWEDWENDRMYNAEPWLRGDAFDAVMNYRWAREVCHFFRDRSKKITASEFDRKLRDIRGDYRADVNYVLMNLMASHDTDRLGSQVVNVDASYDKRVSLRDNPEYDIRKPNEHEIQIQRLIVLYQMTGFGAPMIYYGDEAGMWGGDDPDDRKPMLWPDLVFAPESHHPFGQQRPADINEFDRNLVAYHRTLIGIRRGHKALSRGDYSPLITDDARDLYAFQRSYGHSHIMVVLNNSEQTQEVDLPVGAVSASVKWTTLFAMSGCEMAEGGSRLRLAAKSGLILATGGS